MPLLVNCFDKWPQHMHDAWRIKDSRAIIDDSCVFKGMEFLCNWKAWESITYSCPFCECLNIQWILTFGPLYLNVEWSSWCDGSELNCCFNFMRLFNSTLIAWRFLKWRVGPSHHSSFFFQISEIGFFFIGLLFFYKCSFKLNETFYYLLKK